LYQTDSFNKIRAGFDARSSLNTDRLEHDYFQSPTPVSLVFEDVEQLWQAIAERDDWSRFEQTCSHIESARQAYGLDMLSS
ncbi:MAG: selenoprotein O, partial [Henriciella sp.]